MTAKEAAKQYSQCCAFDTTAEKTRYEMGFIDGANWKGEQLQQRIKEFRFAEWASGQGWKYHKRLNVWRRKWGNTYGSIANDQKTTPELWVIFEEQNGNK